MNLPDDEQEIEQSTDDLWLQSREDDATASVDDAEAGAESTPTEDETAGAETPFDPEAFKRELYDHFEKTVLPQRDEYVLREAQKRARQLQADRDQRINDRLAPVFSLLKRQQEAGYITPEDAQAQLRETHREIASQEEDQAKRQAEWETRQQWLAQQQTQPPVSRPAWAEAWENHFNHLLQRSGLQDGDPELERIPQELSDPDPQRAKVLFESALAEAVKEKQQRVKATPPRKQADLRTLPDMGVGAGAGGVNPLAGTDDIDELWKLTGI